MNIKQRISAAIPLLLGVTAYLFVTWRWNIGVAAWIAPALLIRYARGRDRWYKVLPVLPLLWAASFLNKTGAWDMDFTLEVALLGVATLPMVLALFLDRYASRRLGALVASFVFPATFVALDYLIALMPLGTNFGLGASQFYFSPLIQVAAVAGVWGVEFLVLWAAPVANAAWEAGFDLRRAKVPVAPFAAAIALALGGGGLSLVLDRPVAETVRVAGITVEHARDYWTELIDAGTPRAKAAALLPEFAALEDRLFEESARAAAAGAKVLFWSEADAFIPDGGKGAFYARAARFARERGVYFMPAFQVLREGATSGFNGLALFTPAGELAFEYEKTVSWYATGSDGVLRSVATPYGRIGAAICFDFDFPALIAQAARQGVDIMLDPAYDTFLTRLYHTEVGLLRAVEGGFSMARMVNEGSSIAVDYRGRVVAFQDYFRTAARTMYADLPTRGRGTLYGALGDWMAWASLILTAALCLILAIPPARRAVFRRGA